MVPSDCNKQDTGATWTRRLEPGCSKPPPPVGSPALSFCWPYLPFPQDTSRRRRPRGRCRSTPECRKRRHNHQCSRCSHRHSSRSHTHSHSLHCGWCRCLRSDRHWAAAGTRPHLLCRTALWGQGYWVRTLMS